MKENKAKFALYLPPEKKAELKRRCQEDGGRSLTKFIEKAIDFYLGYLDANSADAFLPKEIPGKSIFKDSTNIRGIQETVKHNLRKRTFRI